MTLKYREEFRNALSRCKLTAVQHTDMAHALMFGGDAHLKFLEKQALRAIRDNIGRAVMERVTITTAAVSHFRPFTIERRATVNVISDDELDRLIQATVERARADLNWRRNRAPSYPSGR